MKKLILILLLAQPVLANQLLVPMDLSQSNHLKAYGFTFDILNNNGTVHWMLNYRGGSFMTDATSRNELQARLAGVDYVIISDAEAEAIRVLVQQENMEEVLLEKPPKIAVYAPPNFQPWDDAVTLALNYAGVSYDLVFDKEVLLGKLDDYDWLHLHHEDFTGQYGKFWLSFRNAQWYIENQMEAEELAQSLGFDKVWKLKHNVALKIRDYVDGGGFIFAMCSATDTIDLALAYLGTDIAPQQFDGDGIDPAREQKRNDSRTFAFTDFTLMTNPMKYEFSTIDTSDYAKLRGAQADYFTLFDFSAKQDPVPTMLTQCHVNVINGFMGQTTGYKKDLLKKHIIILAEVEGANEVRYIHGKLGDGTFTFYGGHDPEDYQHRVGDPPTDLDLHRTSPGYRLILNNILFPAAKKKKLKT
ncbi:asparagine synthetase B [bacterium]|jgi:hypothetical protein|nr:asparagine synthetase B [bacterium]MBT4292495.1 asparagine synthetase B [bacterium]MBT7310767.1 asparagine synthetase B [bacterium]